MVLSEALTVSIGGRGRGWQGTSGTGSQGRGGAVGRVWVGLRLAGPGLILEGSGECCPSVRPLGSPTQTHTGNEAFGVMIGVGWPPRVAFLAQPHLQAADPISLTPAGPFPGASGVAQESPSPTPSH